MACCNIVNSDLPYLFGSAWYSIKRDERTHCLYIMFSMCESIKSKRFYRLFFSEFGEFDLERF